MTPMFFISIILLVSVVVVVRHRVRRIREKKDRREREIWSIGVYEGPSPFELGPVSGLGNPVLTAADVHDVKARFVADPFMLSRDGVHHLFFEVLNSDREIGEIGHATSPDMKRWTYSGIVLREDFHLSYPYVFADGDAIYMVPECAGSGGIQLYRAEHFPDRWSRVATLVESIGRYAPELDTSLVRHEGRWYLFSYARKVDQLHLFSADSVTGPWKAHPKSPVVSGSPHYARPGGRVVEHEGALLRFSQDGIPNYGSKVWAFRITELSEREYREEALPQKPVVAAGNEPWNRKGMHTVDPHQVDGRWIAMVDGLSG